MTAKNMTLVDLKLALEIFPLEKVSTPRYLFLYQFEKFALKKSFIGSQPLLQLAPTLFPAVGHKLSQTTCQPLGEPGGYHVTHLSQQ